MWFTGKRKKITQIMAGMGAMVLLGAPLSCRAEAPLLPVDAPLASASVGERFAPTTYATESHTTAPLPPQSTGTHVTAVLPCADGTTLVAVWGDPVIWKKKGNQWEAASNLPRLTGSAAEVVMLREENNEIIVGTRRDGEFVARNGAWQNLPRANMPYDANAQAMGTYRGALFVATLNDGLVIRDAKGIWQHVAPPTISTNAPRQFVVWHDNLYVRHGNGVVDCFDGRTWTRDLFTKPLPRRQVSAMAVSGDTLYLAQWGGWSETTDGSTFTNRFPDALRNLPITALLPQGEKLYVGTQGRGLAEFDAAAGSLRRWYDERQGIGDDWITTLTPTGNAGIVAGTFVAGAFGFNTGASWQPLPTTAKDCVTASIATPTATFVALRRGGVVRYATDGTVTPVSAQIEAQSLCADEANHLLWIGTRTGIYTVMLQ